MVAGQLTHIEVDKLLQKEVVERRNPIQFIGRHTQIDRDMSLAKITQIEVTCCRRGIDQWIEPKAENACDGLFNVGKAIVRTTSKIGQGRQVRRREEADAPSGIRLTN